MKHFNPRSPHGERLQGIFSRRSSSTISIHAPRTGSDRLDCGRCVTIKGISIHAPRTGSDSNRTVIFFALHLFQSTLPARGATCQFEQHFLNRKHFNPRSPHGERPLEKIGTRPAESFQSTLPARGATRTGISPHCISSISIHAPRTGSDVILPMPDTQSTHFNPRSPHGERLPV